MEVDDGFDLPPIRGKGDVAILIGICSSMGCPHTELFHRLIRVPNRDSYSLMPTMF